MLHVTRLLSDETATFGLQNLLTYSTLQNVM